MLALVAIMYLLLDLLAITCVLVMVDRAEVKRLLPYVFIYGLFHAYLVRTVRLVAYVQEWVFVASRRDLYVPARVADKAPFY